MEARFETFTVLINRISRNIRKIKIGEMAEYDLRSAHISCLYYLFVSDVKTATDIVEKCDEDKATISRSLEYLEKEGYLIRNGKRYNSIIELSEKGRMTAEQISCKINHVLDEVSFDFSDEQRKMLYESLFTIADRLEQIQERIEEGEVL